MDIVETIFGIILVGIFASIGVIKFIDSITINSEKKVEK